jgi:hypothetical protein
MNYITQDAEKKFAFKKIIAVKTEAVITLAFYFQFFPSFFSCSFAALYLN